MSIIEHAKAELAAINFGDEDSRVMIEILEKFFEQWDSGGAVSCAAPVLQRLIAGKPLGPLTGADSEWHDPLGDGRLLQNLRCSSVFKDRCGRPNGPFVIYDIDAADPLAEVTFPYWPDRAEVGSPIITVESPAQS